MGAGVRTPRLQLAGRESGSAFVIGAPPARSRDSERATSGRSPAGSASDVVMFVGCVVGVGAPRGGRRPQQKAVAFLVAHGRRTQAFVLPELRSHGSLTILLGGGWAF